VRLILQHGVDPDVAGDGGATMLHHLATVAEPPVPGPSGEQEPLALAAMLLDAGASLAKRDSLLKSTPLGWASRWGRLELAKLYLDRGADPLEQDAEAWATPLAWATKGGHGEIVRLLASRGASA
jgi:ankyrin repeat protein